jgi:hypothetical protein
MPVARHPRCVVNNCLPLADQAVEKGGFAHVGSAHDGYDISHFILKFGGLGFEGFESYFSVNLKICNPF